MRAPRKALAAILVASLLAAGAACGDDDDEPAAEPPATEAPATTEPPETEAPVAGDVAAGETFFRATCTSCHLDDGRSGGGVGPQLAGAGLTDEQIRTTIMEGPGPMPPNLATGEDLDNVVAYVLSLQ